MPCDLQKDCEFDLDDDLLPQTDEVAIGDTFCLDEDSFQDHLTYDPSQSLDDLFAGLNEKNPVDGNDIVAVYHATSRAVRGFR